MRGRQIWRGISVAAIALLACGAGPPQRDPLEGPWNHDLWLYPSEDGLNFAQESGVRLIERGGVPSAIRGASGRLVLVFQWFPLDRREAFDRVAVVFSTDDGATWSASEPAVIEGLPEGYMRPFDPAIVQLEDGRYRLYFTSQPPPYREPAIYSAISEDAIHYRVEPGIRSAGSDGGVVDACAVLWQGVWHLYAHYQPEPSRPGERGRPHTPRGYHGVSSDGLAFEARETISVPERANWIGNVLPMDGGLRFFGSSMRGVWSAFSTDGFAWTIDPGIRASGGDTTVFRARDGGYRMITVGKLRADAAELPEEMRPRPASSRRD